MIYLYLAGVVVTFVVLCSISEYEWGKKRYKYETTTDTIINDMLKTFELFVLSLAWIPLSIMLLLSVLAKYIKKLNIRFDFKNEEPYDD